MGFTTLQPIDEAFLDDAPWRFDFPGTFHAPVADVWAAFVDNEGWVEWFAGCKRCMATSTPFGGVGSTRTISVNGMRVDEQFIVWTPEQEWGFSAVSMRPPLFRRLGERARFTDLGDGRTSVDYRMAIDPQPSLKPLRKLLTAQSHKSFAKSYAALDERLRTRR